jgi:hypothetical protein
MGATSKKDWNFGTCHKERKKRGKRGKREEKERKKRGKKEEKELDPMAEHPAILEGCR